MRRDLARPHPPDRALGCPRLCGAHRDWRTGKQPRGSGARQPSRGAAPPGHPGTDRNHRSTAPEERHDASPAPSAPLPFVSHPALTAADPELAALVGAEEQLQADTLRLIPSENYVSAAVLEATGTVLQNKYSEGYAGRRYYEGQQNIDRVETLAVERAKAVFGVEHANVQPYSGSPANLAAYLAFAEPGDTVLGMALPMGGHLTHGWGVSATGKWFRGVQYGVRAGHRAASTSTRCATSPARNARRSSSVAVRPCRAPSTSPPSVRSPARSTPSSSPTSPTSPG